MGVAFLSHQASSMKGTGRLETWPNIELFSFSATDVDGHKVNGTEGRLDLHIK